MQGPEACFITASSAPLVAPGQAPRWGEQEVCGHPRAVTHFLDVLGLGPQTPTSLTAQREWLGGASLVPASGEVMGRILVLLGVGLGNG